MNTRKRKVTANDLEENKKRLRLNNDSLKELEIHLERCDLRNRSIVKSTYKVCKDQKSINDLPTEMLLNIFSYLSYAERKQISVVCKKWNIICSERLLNRSYTIGPKLPLCKVIEMLKDAPYLDCIRVVMRKGLQSILHTIPKCNKRIRSIKIEKCLECRIKAYIQITKRPPSLKSLTDNTIVMYGLKAPNIYYLYENFLTNSISTKRVKPCSHSRYFGESYKFFIRSGIFVKLFRGCKNLKYIKTSYNVRFEKDEDVQRICSASDYKLLGINFCAELLTDRAINIMSKCKNLTVLKLLNACKLTSKSIGTLKKFTKLKTLHLTNTKLIGKESWKCLFSQRWVENLQNLNLTGCKRVDDTVLQVIAKNCKSLKRLKLCWCMSITGKGLTNIIKGCKELTHLDIKYTRKKVSKGLKLIAQHLKKLKTLSCEKKHVHKKLRKQLLASCPKLVIT